MKNTNLFRQYVRSLLLEMSMEDVKSSKDPLDWLTAAWQDPEEWSDDGDPFRAMLSAAEKSGLKDPIGFGSSRIVFDLGNNTVVKLARNQKGVEQNKLEIFAGKDPQVDKILAHVLDHSDEYAWIVAEKVKPLLDSDGSLAEKMIGIPWNEVRKLVGQSPSESEDMTVQQVKGKQNKKQDETPEKTSSNCLKGQEFLDHLTRFLERYSDMLLGDITKLSSWGISADNCLVLLDYGITRKKFKELY